jgi:peptidoglycan/LPS O-acetylase OafA/YrhL
MGFAILWVITLHYQFFAGTPAEGFFRIGALGVDIFITLSAFGLCFSLSKDSNYLSFIKKRVLRILPTWWLLITVMMLVGMTLAYNNHPHNISQFLYYYSGLGWWFFHNEPFGIYYYEWYIPTILLFYLLIPWLYRWSNKVLLLSLILAITGGVLLSFFHIEERLNFSYFRVAAFIYGILLYRGYKMVQEGRDVKLVNTLCTLSSVIGISGMVLLFFDIVGNNYGALIYCFMLSMPLLFHWAVILFAKCKLTSLLSFVGTITLELYLIHLYDLPLNGVMKFINDRNVAIVVTTILLIGVSYLVSKGVSYVMKKVK